MQIIKTFLKKLRVSGMPDALSYLKHKILYDHHVNNKRIFLSKKINSYYNSTVAYGLFKGLRFINNSWWAKADRASMILGFYEKRS